MAVFRVEKTRDYTVMSNYHLKDRSLSLKSKGLISMMLSLPDEWNYTTCGLAAICKEGVDAIGASLKELEKAGYLVRNRLRDERGRITDTEYVIYEKPHEPDYPNTASPCPAPPHTEKPCVGKQDMVSPCTDNTTQYNTNQVTPKKSKTYSENNHGLINHPINPQGAPSSNQPRKNPMDEMDSMRAYRALIMENIEYGTLAERYGKWWWNSQDIGGVSALDYLIKVRGMSFVSAVETLVGERAADILLIKPKDYEQAGGIFRSRRT